MASTARSYPRLQQIARQFEIARQLGLEPKGFSVAPDGTISVFEVQAPPANDLDGLVERE